VDEVWRSNKWKGHVTEILQDGFVAELRTSEIDREAIIAEFDFDELNAGDIKILAVGRPVVWAIFTERRKGGLQNASTLYLRRPSPPTAAQVGKARAELDEWFGSNDVNGTGA
jgi:hypothetical protein